jgi:hypothetical protein
MIWHVASDADVSPGNTVFLRRNFVQHYMEKGCITYGIRHADGIIVQTEHQAADLAVIRPQGRRGRAEFSPGAVRDDQQGRPRSPSSGSQI